MAAKYKVLEMMKKKKDEEAGVLTAQDKAEAEQKAQESSMQKEGTITASDEAATRQMFKRKKAKPVNPEDVSKAIRYKKGY